MQITTETIPPIPLLTGDIELKTFEPKRVVLSPVELCLLSEPDDLFEDD
jgi:hypothetical protein